MHQYLSWLCYCVQCPGSNCPFPLVRKAQRIIYTILYYTIKYTILYYKIYYTILYYKIYYKIYYTILYYTILYYTILSHAIRYYTILYDTIRYYTVYLLNSFIIPRIRLPVVERAPTPASSPLVQARSRFFSSASSGSGPAPAPQSLLPVSSLSLR